MLRVAAITRPGRYWLFVETGDDVLDYREAVAFYAGALHDVVYYKATYARSNGTVAGLIGTIIDIETLKVRLKGRFGGQPLGEIEESFAATLTPGDTFLIGGQVVRYEVGNVYDPAYTMVCKVEKKWLPRRRAAAIA